MCLILVRQQRGQRIRLRFPGGAESLWVFVQKHVSAAKIFKSLVYGGRVVRIDGDMAAASRICGEMVKRRKWFQCGGPNPYRIAAKRTFAYGIVQQLGRAPDTVLIPCGGGARDGRRA